MCVARGVGVVFGLSAVADNKNLNIVEQSAARPKRISAVTVYLVERLFDVDSAPFKFDVNHWQTVDEDCNVVAVFVRALVGNILIYNLQLIAIRIGGVNEVDVFGGAVVACKGKCACLLNFYGAVLNHVATYEIAAVGIAGDVLLKKRLPFVVGEFDAVEGFELKAQVFYHFRFGVDFWRAVALRRKRADKFVFETRLALILVVVARYGSVLRHNGAFLLFDDDGLVHNINL